MPERRLPDDDWLVERGRDRAKCRDREHYPASMVVRPPGTFRHECPSCHQVTTFIVPEGPSP